MTDPVEAAREALIDAAENGKFRRYYVDDLEAAIRADVVPTGDAGLDVERLARAEWEIFGGARASGSTWDEQDQAYRERMVSHYRAVAAEYARLSSSDTGGHQHRWVDARNEAVTSGEVCPDCGAIRASDTGGRG